MVYLFKALIELYSAAVLLVVVLKLRSEVGSPGNAFLFLATVSTVLVLCLDSISWLVSSRVQPELVAAATVSKTLFFFLHPVGLTLWVAYVDYSLLKDRRRIIRTLQVLGPQIVLLLGLLIWNLWSGWLFHFDDHNLFARGKGFLFFCVWCYLFLIYTQYLVLRYRKLGLRELILTLLWTPMIPAAAGIFQILFDGLPALWIVVSLLLLIVLLNVHKAFVSTDFLTGVHTRRRTEQIIAKRLQTRTRSFSLIMVDVDYFKKINDTYGHAEGDCALGTVSKVLSDSIRQNDIVCRYGGDEFLVFLDGGSPSGLETVVRRIRESVDSWNASGMKEYRLSLSLGHSVFPCDQWSDLKAVLRHVDHLMYEAKVENHRRLESRW